MTPFLSSLSPDAALLLLTLGIALIALELNRPGSILPGTAGLLLTLLAGAGLLHRHPRPAGLALTVAASGALLVPLRLPLPLWALAVTTLSLIAGLLLLFPAGQQPSLRMSVAIGCGLFTGIGTTVLTRIARRARRNKGLD
jgi:membrane-bound ClpP family serine protease